MSQLNHLRTTAPTRLGMLLFVVTLIIAPCPAHAHPESFSNVRLTLAPSTMHVTLILPVRDLSRWFPAGRYKNYTADVVRELGKQAGDLLVVGWDGQVANPTRTNVHPGQVGFIIVEEDFGIPAGAGSLQMRSALLANLPNDHQQLALVEDARGGASAERILAEETLTAQQDEFAVDLPEVAVVATKTTRFGATLATRTAAPVASASARRSAFIALIAIVGVLLAAIGLSRFARGRTIDTRSI